MSKLILFVILVFGPTVHDIHLSMCDIESKKDRLEVTLKVFLDDLQVSMGLTPGQELPDDYQGSDELIKTFVDQSFDLQVDGKSTDLRYIESLYDGEAVWITLYADKPDTISTISVTSSILTSLFSDQVNVVNCDIFGRHQVKMLDTKKVTCTFSR